MSKPFASTPPPPYYAVIFTNQLSSNDHGYADTAEAMAALAATQPGCLGLESVRDATGLGITVSYWRDEASIQAWRDNAAHAVARQQGRDTWYEHFELRVARVERAYDGP
ncbi:MAG: antibiotic biosynthesis monooxygenase [Pseudomonadales bacterium]|nr:antibiotic biosynthesis monooxygenase [Pseudomonadales bacterium]MCP5182414.1 antibiotic biosynthesis monooxygenase [Pseudomonadales bacterium]